MSITLKDNILSEEDINFIFKLPQVITAKKELDSKTSGHVYFLVNLPLPIKNKIYEKIGLKLDFINMRWIKGDKYPQIDTSVKQFKKTKLTDNQGELIENEHYPVMKGSAPDNQGHLIDYNVEFNFTEKLLDKFSDCPSNSNSEHDIIGINVITRTINQPYSLIKVKNISYNVLGKNFKNTVNKNFSSNPLQKNNMYFSLQHVYFNQKSSFCGTRSISSTAVGIGAIRGKGSATRIFNNCRNKNIHFQLCQYRCLGLK